MTEYAEKNDCIRRDAAMDLVDLYWQQAYNAHFSDAALRLGSLYLDMEDIPAAAVRPVVTCEECVWHVDDGCHNCTKLGMLCPDDADFYCKYGRRPQCGTDMREES